MRFSPGNAVGKLVSLVYFTMGATRISAACHKQPWSEQDNARVSSMEQMEIFLVFFYKNGNLRFCNINPHPLTVRENYFKLTELSTNTPSSIWNIIAKMD